MSCLAVHELYDGRLFKSKLNSAKGKIEKAVCKQSGAVLLHVALLVGNFLTIKIVSLQACMNGERRRCLDWHEGYHKLKT